MDRDVASVAVGIPSIETTVVRPLRQVTAEKPLAPQLRHYRIRRRQGQGVACVDTVTGRTVV
ncbi:MAG: hypothetical protein EXR54_07675 [Dehalococcoidia bacterium]|nr:hypothetical protein [Dehalococcoidia bacterium]MSQ17428.1 hypothetical protein [Dehalococcoidia bacterium]